MVLPKRPLTSLATCLPVFVDPVKETRPSRLSYKNFSPTSAPVPWQTVNTELNPLALKTSVTILPTATVTKDVDSLPFQIIVLPQISPIAVFQPATAQGKLKAEITPMFPIGFHYSIIMWPGLSLGKTLPPIILDIPTAMSQVSIYSYTSPSPSLLILPTSKASRDPRASFFSLSSFPIYLTMSPRIGIGRSIHLRFSSSIAATQSS